MGSAQYTSWIRATVPGTWPAVASPLANRPKAGPGPGSLPQARGDARDPTGAVRMLRRLGRIGGCGQRGDEHKTRDGGETQTNTHGGPPLASVTGRHDAGSAIVHVHVVHVVRRRAA